MFRRFAEFVGLVWLLTLLPAATMADLPDPDPFPATPLSMGQPRRVRLTWGPLGGYDFDAERHRSRLFVALNSEPRIPQIGFARLTMEGAVGAVGSALDLGIGAYLKIPWVKAGVEYNFTDDEYIPGFSAEMALKRGGLFRNGDELRIDYRPWDRQVMVGVTFNSPFHPYRMTRPRRIHQSLPDGEKPKPDRELREHPLPEEMLHSLEQVERSIEWMDKLLTPRFEGGDDFAASAQAYRDHIRLPGHTFAEEDAAYHQALAQAFRVAVGGDAALGDDLARTAEAVILEKVLIPFDRLFGCNKKPHHVRGFGAAARAAFDDSLLVHLNPSATDPDENRRAMILSREVFRRTVDRIDKVSGWGRKRWKQSFIFWLRQSRLVWLPLNYGLRPAQIDTPEEWNALAQALTGQAFTDANTIEYLPNEQFHLQLKRMIRQTEAYQVLQIHDFRGQYGKRVTDRVGWDLVIDGYMEAFREAVSALDRGDRSLLPQFMLYLDENYYEANRSRGIITYLEHLYDPDEVEVKPDSLRQRLDAAHRRLRDAVDASPAFRGLSRKRREELIRVHVNITHPFDVAFAADAPMRDHRKLAFRDVFETDPASGEALFTGQGVGEHYNGTGWEDRSILVRGPALVDLKTAVRELVRSQGFTAAEVPEYLQAQPLPADYAARCQQLRERGWTTPVSLVFNRVGYGAKPATVLKAFCYNLAPKDSYLLSFDSLWISDYWAGMFIGAALRGARAYVVAPGPENAPSSAPPTMVLMRENMDQMRQGAEFFREDIRAAGGVFHVGFYDLDVPVNDLRGRVKTVLDRRQEYAFLEEEFPFHPAVLEVLREVADAPDPAPETLEPGGIIRFDSGHDPFIHSKTQFFGTGELSHTMTRPEWAPVVKEYLAIRSRQLRGRETEGITPRLLTEPGGPDAPPLAAVLDSILAASSPAGGRPRAWLSVGSQNQDRRGMLLDGEAMAVVSGRDGLAAMPDFMFILGSATWPSDLEEFKKVFPEVKGPGLLKKLYRYIKDQI